MSYILDALKKAEAEREGAAQALPAAGPPVPSASAAAQAPAPGLRPDAALPAPGGLPQPMVWAVAGLSVALAGVALGWMMFGRDTGAPVQVADAGATSAVSTGPAEAPATPAPVAPVVSTMQPSVPEEPAVQAEPPQPPVDEPVRMNPPSREALQDETPPPVMQFSTSKPRVPAPTPSASLNSTPPALRRDTVREVPPLALPAEPPRIYAANELPPNIRQQLPQLSVGGAMYSESPGSRMLILNGQPFKEGDQPMAHLKLEQINLKSAVLSYKGYRYAINY
jgi:general secretion pathway protein B